MRVLVCSWYIYTVCRYESCLVCTCSRGAVSRMKNRQNSRSRDGSSEDCEFTTPNARTAAWIGYRRGWGMSRGGVEHMNRLWIHNACSLYRRRMPEGDEERRIPAGRVRSSSLSLKVCTDAGIGRGIPEGRMRDTGGEDEGYRRDTCDDQGGRERRAGWLLST